MPHQPGIHVGYQQPSSLEGGGGIVQSLILTDQDQCGRPNQCKFVIGQRSREQDVRPNVGRHGIHERDECLFQLVSAVDLAASTLRADGRNGSSSASWRKRREYQWNG